jgi:hypothetical protein
MKLKEEAAFWRFFFAQCFDAIKWLYGLRGTWKRGGFVSYRRDCERFERVVMNITVPDAETFRRSMPKLGER